jgi:hypothetical protein
MAGGSSAVDFARRFVREDHEAPRVVLNCQGVGVCGRNNVKRHDFISELESFFFSNNRVFILDLLFAR